MNNKPNITDQALRILILEDVPADVGLIARELKKANIHFVKMVVDNGPSFVEALKSFSPDIILSDHSLPSLDSFEALKLVQKAGIRVPFILITATLPEEVAVGLMKLGAWDYFIKDRLHRLPLAIMGAMEKYRMQEERLTYVNNVIASEALFRQAEDIAHFGIWKNDLLKQHTVWSAGTYRILGYEPGEIDPSTETFLNTVDPTDLQSVRAVISDALSGSGPQTMVFRINNKHGKLRYISTSLLVQHNDLGTPVSITGFNHDVTEQKLAELEIQALAESLEQKVTDRTARLQEANKDLEAFNYMISHDLRTPLLAIDMFHDLMFLQTDVALDDNLKSSLANIKECTTEMNDLINRLLEFSKTGRRLGEREMELEEVNMDSLVREIFEGLQALEPTRQMELDMTEAPAVFADRILMKVILVNLLSNAIKYSSKKDYTIVEVSGLHNDGFVEYTVKDNGVGFNMKGSQRLFKPFSRLHRDHEFKGIGVGLAIVEKAVIFHHGTIHAYSEMGNGATFSFTIPQKKVL